MQNINNDQIHMYLTYSTVCVLNFKYTNFK